MGRRKPIAVVDTNIMLSLMTCVDLAAHSEERGWSAHSARSRARERLLPDWMIGDPSSEGPGLTLTAGTMEAEIEKLWEGEPTGHAADQLYVNKAKEFGIPLIAFEGFRQHGTIDPKAGIRVKARAAGVTAMTPAEFYAGRDEHQTCTLFFERLPRPSERLRQ